jgi:hypothetical protein
VGGIHTHNHTSLGLVQARLDTPKARRLAKARRLGGQAQIDCHRASRRARPMVAVWVGGGCIPSDSNGYPHFISGGAARGGVTGSW